MGDSLRFSPKAREIGAVNEELLGVFRQLVVGAAPWPLFLYGGVGVGKTCAVLALLDYVARGEYQTVDDVVEKVRRSWRPRGAAVDWSLLKPQSCSLLVLDELGLPGGDTSVHYLAVQKILDMRENNPLVVVSNLDLAAVEVMFDDRIASRCGAGTVVEYKGRDRRMT